MVDVDIGIFFYIICVHMYKVNVCFFFRKSFHRLKLAEMSMAFPSMKSYTTSAGKEKYATGDNTWYIVAEHP